MARENGISRRAFLGTSLGAAVLPLTACHSLRTGPEPAGMGVAAGERLHIGAVGIGGRGSALLDALGADNDIVALCDVDQAHAGHAFKRFPKAKRYLDFRRMLESEKGIDAVLVATPDHSHALVSQWAMRMGKHVYCEKPLAWCVDEARQMARTAREMGVATQMGNTGQASEAGRALCEYIWGGAIGPVRRVDCWTDRPAGWWPQGIGRPSETPAVPGTLDWDLWLGPAPERPYNPAYLPFRWRGWLDFGTGALGDIATHSFAPIFRAVKLGHPESVEASCTALNNESFPSASIVRFRFPAREDMPPLELNWYDGGLKPPRPPELEPGRGFGKNGTIYIGDDGTIMDGRLLPESRMREYPKPAETLERSPGHFQEWVAACKGGAPAGSNFDFASLVTEVALLGNIALRTGKKITWDGAEMRITGLEQTNPFVEAKVTLAQANALLSRQYRKGWAL